MCTETLIGYVMGIKGLFRCYEPLHLLRLMGHAGVLQLLPFLVHIQLLDMELQLPSDACMFNLMINQPDCYIGRQIHDKSTSS